MSEKKKIFFILGPTAVGKTELALKLAKELGTEIISCDSRQIYLDMDIGTAKPSKEQRAEVRHYLLDFVPPNKRYTVYDYVNDAKEVVDLFYSKHKIPLIVGGTGLYAKLLVEGIFEMPPVPEKIKKKVEKMTDEQVLAEVKNVDPDTYKQVPHRDLLRHRRALIVYYTTGKTITQMKQETQQNDFEPFFYVLIRERQELYTIINNRVTKMVSLGLLDEVKYVIEKYFGSLREVFNGESRALLSIGYEEMLHYLAGEYDYDTAVDLIRRNSRRFAKRQITFFKQFENAKWINLSQRSEREVLSFLKEDIFQKFISTYK